MSRKKKVPHNQKAKGGRYTPPAKKLFDSNNKFGICIQADARYVKSARLGLRIQAGFFHAQNYVRQERRDG